MSSAAELLLMARIAVSSTGTGCLFSRPKNTSDSRAVSTNRLPRAAASLDGMNIAASTTFWFTSPTRPPCWWKWKVKRHLDMRCACSLTSFWLLPPWGMPILESHSRKLRPSSTSRELVLIDPALIDQNVKPCTYRLELALFGPPDSRQ